MKKFKFEGEYLKEVERAIAKYPAERKQSAVICALDQAQRQNKDGNYITPEAIDAISEMLEMPRMRVVEVASFYTMLNLSPVGKYHIQLCGTTPCMLRGAPEIVKAIEDHLKIKCGETTSDGLFTLTEVECLGACCNAPMIQINDDFFEDLTSDNVIKLLEDLAAGREVKVGSQVGRKASEPFDMAQ